MTSDRPLPLVERATAALRALGITLGRLPGEYRVNFRWGGDATARMAKTLDEALGRGKAADASAPANLAQGKCRRQPGRRGDDGNPRPRQREASVMGRAIADPAKFIHLPQHKLTRSGRRFGPA